MDFIVKGEISIETETGIRISPKIMELLSMVKKTGSLNSAVKELGMSYSYAWNSLYKINCQLNSPLVITHRGGKGGGVAFLTQEGEELLKRFMELQKEIQKLIHIKQKATNMDSASPRSKHRSLRQKNKNLK